MTQPSGAEIRQNIIDAVDAIMNPPPRRPICDCGSYTVIENHGLAFPGKLNGLYCFNGHRLPGQDLPT